MPLKENPFDPDQIFASEQIPNLAVQAYKVCVIGALIKGGIKGAAGAISHNINHDYLGILAKQRAIPSTRLMQEDQLNYDLAIAYNALDKDDVGHGHGTASQPQNMTPVFGYTGNILNPDEVAQQVYYADLFSKK